MMMMMKIKMMKMMMIMMMMMMMRGTCLKHQQESCQRAGGRGGCDKSPWFECCRDHHHGLSRDKT